MRSILKSRAATCAALLLASFPAAALAQGAGYWHTSGSRIVDATGAPVRIAGVNWYGFETNDYLAHGLWAQDYKTVLNTIKSLGYNVIRIPFSNQMVESNPVPTNFTTYANGQPANAALVGQTALTDLDTIVAYAGSIGLRVILDNHRSEAGNSNESNGLWYTSAYPASNWLADWKKLVTRYSASKFTFHGNPTLIGVDLRNEPHLLASGYSGACWTGDTETNGGYAGCPASLTAQNWPVAATAAGNAVLAINPNLLVFVEGTDCYDGTCGWQGANLIGAGAYPVKLSVANRLVYSAHDYGPNLYGQPWFNGNTTQASLNAVWTEFWGYIAQKNIAPVWLGEFGTDNQSTDIQNTQPGSQGQWFEDLVSYLHTNPSVGWTYWALNGEDYYGLLGGNYGATPASALKQTELQTIQFPLAAGSNFVLASSKLSLSVAVGGSGTDGIGVTDNGAFAGLVSFATSGLPANVTAKFSPNPASKTSKLTLTAASNAPAGKVDLTISGTSGSLTTTIVLPVTIEK